MKKIIALTFFITAAAGYLAAQEVNESDLFSNGDNVVVDRDEDNTIGEEKKTLSFSGELTSVLGYAASRDWFYSLDEKIDHSENKLDSNIVGSLYIDARLKDSVKGFADIEGTYDGSADSFEGATKELFLDFNIGNRLYFRTGKQVLQWGRCYLWNPTDLVNIEKKSFFDKVGSREGNYGIKTHIPFGTVANIYGFIDTARSEDADTVAGAAKFEFLLGESEMAFSGWGKKGYHPVAGYDLSTRVLGIDILAEASVSKGSNTNKLVERNGTLYVERDNSSWIAKASIDFGKSFDVGDQNDKVSMNLEFFYNGDGYTENVLKDEKNYRYSQDITFSMADGSDMVINEGFYGSKAVFLQGAGLYDPNYYSKYYVALFTTINKFFISDLALNVNVIGNIPQQSAIVSTGLEYSNINDFTASINVNSYIGRDETEYVAPGVAEEVTCKAGITF